MEEYLETNGEMLILDISDLSGIITFSFHNNISYLAVFLKLTFGLEKRL